MKVFIHGGRIGDTVYALHAMKLLGGGIFQQCLRHAPVRWDELSLKRVLKLVEYQSYVNSVRYVKVPQKYMMPTTPPSALEEGEDPIAWTHSFIDSESQSDPENYPDLCNVYWLHYVHQSRRHCHYFNVKWNPEDAWIEAPSTKKVDIVFHAPSYRLVRSKEEWQYILEILGNRFNLKILCGEYDKDDWANYGQVVVPNDFLEAADYIKSAKCFLGAASCCYAMAEGMKQYRFVEFAPDCFNNYPYGKTGRLINHWSSKEVIGHVRGFVNEL